MTQESLESVPSTFNGHGQGTLFTIGDAATLAALSEVIASEGCKVRGFASAESFLGEFRPEGPSCLVLAERLPGMNGSELLRRLSEAGVRIPSVLVTGYASTPITVDAMRHGAITVLERPCPKDALQEAVRVALSADAERLRREEPIREARQRLDRLSVSERQVLQMVTDGVPNKQIASRLGVCVRTVESRRSKIYQAAGVHSVAELVRMCISAGVVAQ